MSLIRRLRLVHVLDEVVDRCLFAHMPPLHPFRCFCHFEDLQKAAGHRDPSTTKLYDRRGYNSEKAASFFATS